eukprot:UN06869
MDVDNPTLTILDKVKSNFDTRKGKIIAKLVRTSKSLKVDPEVLSEEWDAFSFQSGGRSLDLNEENLESFLTTIKGKHIKRKDVNISHTPVRKKPIIQTPVRTTKTFKTPAPKYAVPDEPEVPMSVSRQKYAERSNSGQTVWQFGKDREFNKKRPEYLPKLDINIDQSIPTTWLWEKTHELVSSQRSIIDDFGERFRKNYFLNNKEAEVLDSEDFFENLNKPNQTDAFYVGRIVNENPEKRLTSSTIFLESFDQSLNTIVKLDLSKMNDFATFGGQVVVIKGINPDGKSIVVHEIFTNFASPKKKKALQNETIHKKRGGLELSVQLASGPFWCNDTFGWNEAVPFHDFLKKAAENKPDALILCGPFIDSKNKTLDELTRTFEEEFVQFCLSFHSELVKMKLIGLKVFFIPSVRDIFHRPNFPQPPFKIPSFEPPETWYFLSNPCNFTIENVRFGVSTMDSLLSLNRSELCRFTVARKSFSTSYITLYTTTEFLPCLSPSQNSYRLDKSCSIQIRNSGCTNYTISIKMFCTNIDRRYYLYKSRLFGQRTIRWNLRTNTSKYS